MKLTVDRESSSKALVHGDCTCDGRRVSRLPLLRHPRLFDIDYQAGNPSAEGSLFFDIDDHVHAMRIQMSVLHNFRRAVHCLRQNDAMTCNNKVNIGVRGVVQYSPWLRRPVREFFYAGWCLQLVTKHSQWSAGRLKI